MKLIVWWSAFADPLDEPQYYYTGGSNSDPARRLAKHLSKTAADAYVANWLDRYPPGYWKIHAERA